MSVEKPLETNNHLDFKLSFHKGRAAILNSITEAQKEVNQHLENLGNTDKIYWVSIGTVAQNEIKYTVYNIDAGKFVNIQFYIAIPEPLAA